MKTKNSKVVAGPGALRPSLLALAVSQMLSIPVADAATIEVNNTFSPSGEGCTLNEAIITANKNEDTDGCSRTGDLGNFEDTIVLPNNAVISFSAGSSSGPGNDGTATPFVGSNITIEGNGSTIERSQATTDLFRLFTVFSRDRDGLYYEGHLTLKDLTIENGNTQFSGGAIYVLGELNLEKTTISSNTSTNEEGFFQGGGAIFVRGSENSFTNINSTVTVTDSIISNNTAVKSGGGISAGTGTTVTLENSTVSGNSASVGGGLSAIGSFALDANVSLNNSTVSGNSAVFGGGLSSADASLSLSNSTVSGNSADTSGAGVYAFNDSTVSLTNSTVSGNSGLVTGGISTLSSIITLNNSTVSGNSGYVTGGIYSSSYSYLTLTNTIVANSIGGGDCYISSSSITANEHNIIEDGSCDTDALNVDPKLGKLGNNGGPTKTHALLAGSLAIDVGDNAACAAAPINSLDQRGETRPYGSQCDIGAVEFSARDQETFFVVPLPGGKSVIFGL